jgi:uracil-DNA glycosylase
LESALAALPKLTTIIALGQVAHQSVVKACGEKLPKRRFAHGAVHHLLDGRRLIDSYHTSRYNQNTGRMNAEMLHEVFALALTR